MTESQPTHLIPTHLILGAGPVGTTTAQRLVEAGQRVRLASRSGRGPRHPAIERIRLDVNDEAATAAAAAGTVAIYNALNPPYHRWAEDWPPLHRSVMAAAEQSGAVLVLMDNLYGLGDTHGRTMRAGDPLTATFSKGEVRAEMARQLLAAHEAGRLRGVIARAGDFVGPEVEGSSLGDRVVPRVLKGATVRVLGSPDEPHSFTYMPDVATTLVALALDPRAWGRAWHVPSPEPITQRQAVQALARAAGTTVSVGSVPAVGLKLAGLLSPTIRGLQEVRYQFEQPFVMDSSETTATFGIQPTSWDEIARATVAWWRDREAGGAHDQAA